MQARSEWTRRRLIRAGADMFNRYGYAGATLGQIAAAAGLTKGALYFHFASKDGLADAVQEECRRMLRAVLQECADSGIPPVQTLIDMTYWLAGVANTDPVVRAGVRITTECAGRQPPAIDFHQEWSAEVRRLIGQAREAGDLSPRVRDAAGAVALLSATMCGLWTLATTPAPDAGLGRSVAELWDLLLTVLVPPGKAGLYHLRAPGASGALTGAA
ncbi:ScbR family autoregulator-binding transcription factor [Streptomyces monashensis]|uniref:HTH tetR-type domain-containing protein n=1 Tax=Streptomyces monashensis TaxID=1678012 RepID=A0A1S2QIM8_9ACTN|nr:ScbR family autoregulator-binding transcription factor [Streptomyces monashensis]OIK06010.1 hypothetical protein BIV23_09965 [Streptomyces monashensis]